MIRLSRWQVGCLASMVVSAVLAWAWVVACRQAALAEVREGQEISRRMRLVAANLKSLPLSGTGAPQPDHVATLARRILVTAGVPQVALVGIQPLGDHELPGGVWHRQLVLLQLRGLTSSHVTAIIDAAARTDPAWSVASIQLNHAGDGDVYDAGLSLTTLYPLKP